MIKWFKQLFFAICGRLAVQQTLQKSTWNALIRNSPGLLAVRKERSKANRYRVRNSFKGAFIIISCAASLLVSACFIPAGFIDHHLSFLQWFSFSQDQQAFSTISEVMGATATIIGLSFVVIGFLFDAVKDKTQRTLEELFRATSLYYVFGISVISIMLLVSINCFKYAVNPYVARNFAVLSSLMLLMVAAAVAFLFYQLLRFFNPEKVAAITSRQLLDMARYRMLDDRFSQASAAVYRERLEAYGYQEKFEYASFLSKGKPVAVWLNIGNPKEVQLLDVCFPLLSFITRRLKKKSDQPGFTALQYGAAIRPNQGILSVGNGTTLSAWERAAVRAAYLTSGAAGAAEDFDLLKEKLEKRLLKASADGDLDGMKQSLDDIGKLYDIFYQSSK